MEDPRFVKQALKVVFEKKQSGDLHRRGSVLMDVPKCSSFSELVDKKNIALGKYDTAIGRKGASQDRALQW